MLASLATAAAIVAAAVLIGQALCTLCGHRTWSWYGPAIGLAVLTVVAAATIKLPGKDTTSAVAVLAFSGASALLVRNRLTLRVHPVAVIALGAVLAASLLPFLANGRFGLLGVSYNNDLAAHLIYADVLRSGASPSLPGLPPFYPLGQHAIADTFAKLTGASLEEAFTALLMAVGLITALTAASLLAGLSSLRRALGAVVTALVYLVASYYAEGAFKETMQALFVLAFAVVLREVVSRPRQRARAAVPLGVLMAASVYTYSYPGLAWFAATAAIWAVFALVAEPWRLRRGTVAALVRSAAVPAAVVGAVALLCVAPELHRISLLFEDAKLSPAAGGVITKTNIGNLAGPLSPYEALGLWPKDDFRFTPEPFRAGMLGALAAGVSLFGVLWWLRRRDLVLPAAAAGAGLIYLYIDRNESAYLSAKALVVMAPLVTVMSSRALLTRAPPGNPGVEASVVKLVAAAVFFGAALYSSYLALQGGLVGPTDHSDELAKLAPRLRGAQTLFLGHDDFYRWELPGVPVSHPIRESKIGVPQRPEKNWHYGEPFDFDSTYPNLLDRFRYVITTRTDYASEPPPNFTPVAQTRSYRVFERRGPTPDRRILPEGRYPTAVLDCRKRRWRRLARRRGTARVVPRIVRGPQLSALHPGGSTSARLRLRPGTWNLSIPYTSTQAVRVTGPGVNVQLPANLDRPGPYWHVARIVVPPGTRAPTTLRLTVRDPSPLDSQTQVTYLGQFAAVPSAPARIVPLSKACGRSVDWYRLDQPSA